MHYQLTPYQAQMLQRVVERGVADSAEDALTLALRSIEEATAPDLLERLGMSQDELNQALDAGVHSSFSPWRGAEDMHQRLTRKHQS